MALPRDFMERVVAWPEADTSAPGWVNLHWKSPKAPGMPGKPFKTLHEFMQFTQYATTKPLTYPDLYFCLSTQRNNGGVKHGYLRAQRNIGNATLLKALWLDIDVKAEKGYPTTEAALEAVDKFCDEAKIPFPSAVVLSGSGGVHVYWISDKPLTVAEWRPYAEGLESERRRLGLKADAGLTTDAARVLRVPGTYNAKSSPPKPVVLKHLGDSYDFANCGLARLGQIKTVGVVTAAVTAPRSAAFDMSAFEGKSPHPWSPAGKSVASLPASKRLMMIVRWMFGRS